MRRHSERPHSPKPNTLFDMIFSGHPVRCLSLCLHLSHALPLNPRRDLAHTHWSSLQLKVGQKASEDRARERQGEGGTIT